MRIIIYKFWDGNNLIGSGRGAKLNIELEPEEVQIFGVLQ